MTEDQEAIEEEKSYATEAEDSLNVKNRTFT